MLAINGEPPAQPIAPTPLPGSVFRRRLHRRRHRSIRGGRPAPVSKLLSRLKAPTGVSDAALLAASVRLRVEDPDGRSCGSGTIIDSRGGEALILTCGHIFRDSQGKGRVTVDLFGSGEPQQVVGERVWFDLTRDVGLVTIRTPGPVAVARLAPPDYKITPGMSVVSVGCNDGDPPTVRHSQVNSLNKFQGPPNLTVAGQPVNGRSGGGLFSSEGYVIGVCNARDPEQQQGLFAAPAAIYAELDRDQLAFVYKSPSGSLDGFSPAASPSVQPTPGPAPSATDWAAAGASPPTPGPVMPANAIESVGNSPLPPHEQAALEELRRQAKEGAKIIIVVCPRGNPEGKGDVIVVDHASQGFVKQVTAEGRRLDRRYENETSLELPKPQKKLSGPRG